MKVHPTTSPNRENLRRLPHVFSKILELPFHPDSDVSVDETPSHFRFTLLHPSPHYHDHDSLFADTIEIYPGISKVVIRGSSLLSHFHTCRFRLPDSTRLDSVTAHFSHGHIVVTVPKDHGLREPSPRFGPQGRLVLVH